MTRKPNAFYFSRRRVLQTLGATGAAAVAGCMGGGSDEPDSEETPTEDEQNNAPSQTSEEPNYGLPDSEHIEPDEFVTGWMLLPPGEDLSAMAYSPSQTSEQHGTTYAETQNVDYLYDMFEFHDSDIPETFVQEKNNQWQSEMKVDQLPNNVSEEDVAQQLQDAGYHKDTEIGDFDVYRGGEGGPRAVGQGKHILSHPINIGDDESAMQYMDNFLSQRVEDELRPGDETMGVINALNVKDSITLRKNEHNNLVTGVNDSRQPVMGAASVDMEAGEKYGAWIFEDEQTAGTVHAMKKDEDLLGYFEEISQESRIITARGTYNGEGLGDQEAQVSVPVI